MHRHPGQQQPQPLRPRVQVLEFETDGSGSVRFEGVDFGVAADGPTLDLLTWNAHRESHTLEGLVDLVCTAEGCD